MQDHDRIIRRLETIAKIGDAEKLELRRLPLRQKHFAENCDLISQGDRATECCVILDGLAARYKVISGGRRSILSVHFSGDLPDLQGLHLAHMDHGIFALTPVRAAFISHDAIKAMTHRNAALADILIRYALIDASIFRQWIANISRRTAYERIAHIFCEVYVRMTALGLVEQDSFHLPMTQAELGDAAGLSPVHVNRVLQRMRKDGLITSKGDVHDIRDWERLREAADFNKDYLHLRRDADEA
jgi:CRP-like cAMP-binding protein